MKTVLPALILIAGTAGSAPSPLSLEMSAQPYGICYGANYVDPKLGGFTCLISIPGVSPTKDVCEAAAKLFREHSDVDVICEPR